MGVSNHRGGQLASANMAFMHAGLPDLRVEAAGTSFDESVASHGKYNSAVFGFQKNDRRSVAKFFRGSVVWLASAARRISGLGFRTQGCLKRAVLDADIMGLRQICGGVKITGREIKIVLWAGAGIFCPGFDGQADARHIAVHFIAAGLVAVGKIPTSKFGSQNSKFDFGKIAVFPAGGGFKHRHLCCPK